VVALVMGVGFVVLILGDDPLPRSAAAPSVTPAPVAAASPSPAPTQALAVRGDGGRPLLGSPAPASTGGPTSDTSLRVEFPREGDTVVSERINAFGRAPAGAVVERVLRDGSTETALVRPDGLWILGVDLTSGVNELRFRIAGDGGDPILVRVTHQPR
jgi:hypothetical protein